LGGTSLRDQKRSETASRTSRNNETSEGRPPEKSINHNTKANAREAATVEKGASSRKKEHREWKTPGEKKPATNLCVRKKNRKVYLERKRRGKEKDLPLRCLERALSQRKKKKKEPDSLKGAEHW